MLTKKDLDDYDKFRRLFEGRLKVSQQDELIKSHREALLLIKQMQEFIEETDNKEAWRSWQNS